MAVDDDGAVYLPEHTRVHNMGRFYSSAAAEAVDKFIDEQGLEPEGDGEEFWDFFVYAEDDKKLYHFVTKSHKNKIAGNFDWTLPTQLTKEDVDTLAEAKQYEFHFQ